MQANHLRFLAVVFGLVVLSFVTTTGYIGHRARAIDEAAVAISDNAAPSILHLSAARSEVRNLQLIVERGEGRRNDPITGKIYHIKFDPPPDEVVELLRRHGVLSLRRLCRLVAPSTTWDVAQSSPRLWPGGEEAPLSAWLAAQLLRLQLEGRVLALPPAGCVNRGLRRYRVPAGSPLGETVVGPPALGQVQAARRLYRLLLSFEVPVRTWPALRVGQDVEVLAGHAQLAARLVEVAQHPAVGGLLRVVAQADVSARLRRELRAQRHFLQLLPPVAPPLQAVGAVASSFRPAVATPRQQVGHVQG